MYALKKLIKTTCDMCGENAQSRIFINKVKTKYMAICPTCIEEQGDMPIMGLFDDIGKDLRGNVKTLVVFEEKT